MAVGQRKKHTITGPGKIKPHPVLFRCFPAEAYDNTKEFTHMKLDELYGSVAEAVSSLDCESIRPSFRPLKFALYDDKKCFFDGRIRRKDRCLLHEHLDRL